jgi:hypothetical protein
LVLEDRHSLDDGYHVSVDDADIETASQVLLAATGPEGHFGSVTRDPLTGELQLVYAARGDGAKALLAAIAGTRDEGWRRHLVRSLVGSGD